MADRPEMFGPARGFSGWPIQWNHAKCCGADHGNGIWPRRGDLVAYRLVFIRLFVNTITAEPLDISRNFQGPMVKRADKFEMIIVGRGGSKNCFGRGTLDLSRRR